MTDPVPGKLGKNRGKGGGGGWDCIRNMKRVFGPNSHYHKSNGGAGQADQGPMETGGRGGCLKGMAGL